jgi:hypothetical protein
MSIFGRIKDAIFGKEAKTAPPPQATEPAASAAPTAAPSAQPVLEVDVERVLSERATRSDQDLNWRSSIVDLMKLLELDSSLGERQELAREFGYTGELDGSAEMNIWLHKRVMTELAKNGGRIPADMLD